MGPSIKGRSIRHLHNLLVMLYVKSQQIYLRELDSKNDTASSDDSVSSEYINNMDQMIEDLKRQIDKNEQQIKKHKQEVAASIQ
jgi:hypothetical protein